MYGLGGLGGPTAPRQSAPFGSRGPVERRWKGIAYTFVALNLARVVFVLNSLVLGFLQCRFWNRLSGAPRTIN